MAAGETQQLTSATLRVIQGDFLKCQYSPIKVIKKHFFIYLLAVHLISVAKIQPLIVAANT